LIVAALIGAPVQLACRNPGPASQALSGAVRSGGELIVTVRSEPRSFNRLVKNDSATDLVALLTQAKLVRINRVTDDVEPWLAESWTRSDDGLRYTVKLRPNVAFSDGHPLTSSDVLFSADAAYSVPLAADGLTIDGRRLVFTAPDPFTVVVTFPAPFAPGVRILDNLWVLPRHKLASALEHRAIAEAWTISTPPSELAGLGPFVLSEHHPGERLVFARNTRYWRTDANAVKLPYLDRVVVEIVPEENTELLRLQSGQTDMIDSEIPAEAYATIKRASDAGQLRLFDIGVALDADTLWMNLKPGAFAGDPRAAWLQRDELRHAVSLAVDRQAFADAVFFGAGVPVYGPTTPANKKWYDPTALHPSYDPARAKQLLASIGLVDRDGDGVLEDDHHQPVRFTLITQKGRQTLERGASVLRDELKKIGILVDVAAIDFSAVVERIMSSKYDAVYFHPLQTDNDPANNMDFWLSSGSGHYWNMAQKTPATDWEHHIDELMTRQMHTLDANDRKRLFDEVQRTLAAHEPVVVFVAPRVFAAASPRVLNVNPAVLRPQLLWSPDTIAVKH